MPKYYTRACNFYFGQASQEKVKKKNSLALYGDSSISFDMIELITRKSSRKLSIFEIKKIKSPTKKSKEPSFIKSIYKVLFADITISFDNVIGVVGAAKGNFGYMMFGLILSVVLTGALATYLANYIQRHLWIAYVGLGFILLVALQLIIGGLNDYGVLSINETFKKYF